MKIKPLPVLVSLAMLGTGVALYAQLEGGDRVVAPLDSSGSFEVTGIEVDVAAKNAEAARYGAWKIAQRKAWKMLWAKMHAGSQNAPALGDGELDSIISGIVVDDEQIGPTRYVAKLGILFDRTRAGQILGVGGQVMRSPPLLVLPIEWSAGGPRSFEVATEWRKAWARFRAGSSPIDYVRPSGAGPDPLLLTSGQAERPGRNWWRMLLDQYGAADVLIPVVRIERMWPGGPIIGHFDARYGPDNRELQSFTLRAENSDGLAALMDEGVKRVDRIYADALAAGTLRTDPSLIVLPPVVTNTTANETGNTSESTTGEPAISPNEPAESATAAAMQSYTVQFDTPDVGSVSTTEAAVATASGVESSSTTSLALGGVSVMSVKFRGSVDELRSALAAAGLRVDGSSTLHIRHAASTTAPALKPDDPRQ